jgi:hypothetical protein
MEIVIVILAMIVVGLIMTYVSKLIWKDDLPVAMPNAYLVGVITAVVVGILDWVIIPAMGFSDTLKYIGIALEPALSVPIVFWIIKAARS